MGQVIFGITSVWMFEFLMLNLFKKGKIASPDDLSFQSELQKFLDQMSLNFV